MDPVVLGTWCYGTLNAVFVVGVILYALWWYAVSNAFSDTNSLESNRVVYTMQMQYAYILQLEYLNAMALEYILQPEYLNWPGEPNMHLLQS